MEDVEVTHDSFALLAKLGGNWLEFMDSQQGRI